MIGVVVVSHGRLAHELLSAAEHVVGQMDQAEAIAIGPKDDPRKLPERNSGGSAAG